MDNITFQKCLSYLLILSLTVSIGACNKEENNQNISEAFPLKLYPVSSSIVYTRVYSRNGEVTDQVLKTAALETTSLNTILRQPNLSLSGNSSYVQFLSPNSFLLEAASYESYTVIKTDSLFQFVSTDTSTNWLPVTHQAPPTLANPFYKYPEFTRLSDSLVFMKRQFSGYGSYNVLSMRGLDFCMIRRDSVTKAFIQRFATISYNEFDPQSIKNLGKYDTIAVRRYDVTYMKR